MIVLSLRTDKPEAEIGLFKNQNKIAYYVWTAHRQLAETLHSKLQVLLNKHQITWSDIEGLVVYKGPGSFTGLRIGLSVANALTYSNNIKIIGETGEHWLENGLKSIEHGDGQKQVMPDYGGEIFITAPKH